MNNNLQIYDAAVRFREALNRLTTSEYPFYWPRERFPKGICGDASLLLGEYFEELGIFGFQYVCGEWTASDGTGWLSHAWLVRGQLCVDITADQFPDAPSAVIVADPSPWHHRFTWGKPDLPNFLAYRPISMELGKVYRRIKLQLRADD